MADMSQADTASSQATEAGSPATVKNTTPVYEVGFHIIPTVGEDGVPAALDKIRAALGSAEIISEGFPQKTPLSYVVERATQGKREKYSEAYFGFIKFATERAQLPPLEIALRAMNEVLRFLIIETTREDLSQAPRRAVFVSDRLEGKTLEKPAATKETPAEVSQEELDKSIDAITG